ncbi:hypothetical protein M9H77_31153 [Catharanthus roseus]|uniref:Uncharacterized protein n=1 Tax=Catharanthus roseus TaxID=4058 RepID=A0ACB9ZZM2_CATRO|nr:hypothetical protein M9H77_31153 [Catharanthus roseus]
MVVAMDSMFMVGITMKMETSPLEYMLELITSLLMLNLLSILLMMIMGSELEKSEIVKEKECFIGKQDSEKEEQREQVIVVFEKSEENFEDSRIEDKGRNMEKELGNFLEDLPISRSLNPSLMWHEISFVELELFLESYLSHEVLLKYFENQMGTNLELFKVNTLAFITSNPRKEAFEQVCKDFVVGHLYYFRPFKEWFLKLFMSFDSLQKNSCTLTLKYEFEAKLFNHLLFEEFFDKILSLHFIISFVK